MTYTARGLFRERVLTVNELNVSSNCNKMKCVKLCHEINHFRQFEYIIFYILILRDNIHAREYNGTAAMGTSLCVDRYTLVCRGGMARSWRRSMFHCIRNPQTMSKLPGLFFTPTRAMRESLLLCILSTT